MTREEAIEVLDEALDVMDDSSGCGCCADEETYQRGVKALRQLVEDLTA